MSISSFHINIDQNVKAEVELWDVSGSNQYESCWSAIQRDAHGVIFVFNPESAAQAKNLDSFHQSFVQGRNVPDTACVVFAHFLSSSQVNSYFVDVKFQFNKEFFVPCQERRGVKLSSKFSRVAQLEINIEDEGARLRADFSTFLASVISGMSKNRDQEEISILNSR